MVKHILNMCIYIYVYIYIYIVCFHLNWLYCNSFLIYDTNHFTIPWIKGSLLHHLAITSDVRCSLKVHCPPPLLTYMSDHTSGYKFWGSHNSFRFGSPWKWLTELKRVLYLHLEFIIKDTGHGTTDLFQIGKEVCQGCILSTCLFNLYAEYIMWNAGLDEAQAGIKIAGRNINNLRYADDTTLMAESEEELKSL